MKKNTRNGFSLIEITIVLIIISILIVGMLSGRSQIKKAKFNAILQEFIVYREMVQLFRTQYDYYPGDFPRAYTVWGSDCAVSANDCDGDGNGIIEYSSSGTSNVEAFRAWQHLYLAGISGDDLPGIAEDSGQADYNFNVPKSHVVEAGWTFDISTFIDSQYSDFANQVIRLGGFRNNTNLLSGFMSAVDAYLFNDKFDNGVANTGAITHYCYDTYEIDRCYNGIVEYDRQNQNLLCFFEFSIRTDIILEDSPCT